MVIKHKIFKILAQLYILQLLHRYHLITAFSKVNPKKKGFIIYFYTLNMPVKKQEAHRALELLEDYHSRLSESQDRALRIAIERVIRIFKSRLFQALLDIQEFYELTLLDDSKTIQQKTVETLQIASKWEQDGHTVKIADNQPIKVVDADENLVKKEQQQQQHLTDATSATEQQQQQQQQNNGRQTSSGNTDVNILATRSIEPSFGLLFGDLLRDLDVGTTGAAVIISTLDVCMNFSGLFVGPLLKEFSYRKVAIAGSILCSMGLAFTSPASSMAHIIGTYGVLNGIGVGLATSAAFVALNHYFKYKRGQAVGLSMAGTALGMLIMPQLVRILLEAFGFRGAVLLLAGVALNATVGSVLLQPAKWHMIDEKIDEEMLVIAPPQEQKVIQEDGAEEDALPEMNTLLFNKHNHQKQQMRKNFSEMNMDTLNSHSLGLPKRPTFPRIMSLAGVQTAANGYTSNSDVNMTLRNRKHSVTSNLSYMDFTGSILQVHMNVGDDEFEQNDRELKRVSTATGTLLNAHHDSFIKMKPTELEKAADSAAEKKAGFWSRFADLMDVDLLKDKMFLNILFGLSIFYVAEMNFKMVTPFFFADLGYNKSDVAYCLSITAITDIAARIVLPPLFDRTTIKKRTIFLVSIIFVAITRSIMAQQTEWNQLMIWLSICGFFRGSALSNFTLTVSEYCSLEKLPSAFGWHLVGKALFVICFGPLIGLIRDVTKSYPICIHAQSFCIVLCSVAWSIEYLIEYLQLRKTKKAAAATLSDNNAAENNGKQ